MLEIQKLLRETPREQVDSVLEELGINRIPHPTDNLSIYNYKQLDAKKICSIARDCRGLVLENETQNLVAKPFSRFFNLGEMIEYHKDFNWNSFTSQSKLDGSLILIFRYENKVYCNTRGSWGNGQINGSQWTWRTLVESIIGKLDYNLIPDYYIGNTYCFELVSIFNKVVSHYPKPELYLLSIFNPQGKELTIEQCDFTAQQNGWKRPQLHSFKSLSEVETYIKELEDNNPTEEGLVLCDSNGMRVKVKNSKWCALARLKDNNNVFLPKYMVPLVLSGEMDEVVLYLPELEDEMYKMKENLNSELENLLTVWNNTKHIEQQKEFALSVIPQTKFASILFTARKSGESPKDIWRNSADLITKVLYK